MTENARRLTDFCAERGVELSFVTKGVSGLPEVIRAVRAGGITSFADSRMKNIIAAKTAMPDLRYLLIRIPALDEAEEVVRWADWSLQSQIETIRAISDAALRQGKVHPIVLMIDVGDLREGVFGMDQLEEIAPQIKACRGVELVGLGTNVGCYGSILPSVANTEILVKLRDYLNEKYGFRITTLSGGATCVLRLLEEGKLHPAINHLRVGEAILYGEDTDGNRFLEGYHTDAFLFKAQVVELKRKPSVPIGERGRDCLGEHPGIPGPRGAPAGHLRRRQAGRGLGRAHAPAARGLPAGGQLRPPDRGRGGLRRAGQGGGLPHLPLRLHGRAGRHHVGLCAAADRGELEG